MKNIFKILITLKIIAIILITNFSFFELNQTFAAFNQEINYQGRLLDNSGDPVSNNGYNIQFKLYTSSVGGSPIWTETHCYSPDNGATCDGTGSDNRIQTRDGLFSVMLGSQNSLIDINFNQVLYLSVNIGGTSTSPSYDGEMTPRKILGAVPAAFEANRINGISSDQFFRNDILNATNSATTSFALQQNGSGKLMELFGSSGQSLFTVNSNGNVGIGTSTPTSQLHTTGSVMFSGNLIEFGTVAAPVNALSLNGTMIQVGGQNQNGVDLFHHTTQVARFTSSQSYLASGNFGINTTNPTEKLTIDGNILFINNAIIGAENNSNLTLTNINNNGLVILDSRQGIEVNLRSTSSGAFKIQNSDGKLFLVDSSTGDVVIGEETFTASTLVFRAEDSPYGNFAGNHLHVRAGNSGVGNTTGGDLFLYGGQGQGTGLHGNVFLAHSGGNVGIGTIESSAKLTVDGETRSQYFNATSTTATSTLPNLQTTNINIAGRLFDGSSSSGVNGYVLQTTSTGVQWVATSTLGLDANIGIGSSISGGTIGSILFVNSSGNLDQENDYFRYDSTNNNRRLFVLDGYNTTNVGSSVFSGDTLSSSSIFGVNNNIVVGVSDQFITVIGNSNDVASVSGSTIVGSLNAVTVNNANVFGTSNYSYGSAVYSSVIGYGNQSTGIYSLSIGSFNTVTGSYGNSVGYNNQATGLYSTAVGVSTRATASGASVFGGGGNALGNMINNVANSTMIGPSATSSIHIFGSTGEVKLPFVTATSTTATSTLPNLQTTNINIAGRLFDGSSSSGVNGYVLQTTSTGVQWVATSTLGISSGGTPGGSDTQIQFNDGGSFGGDSDFTWNKTTNKLTINGSIESNGIESSSSLDFGYQLGTAGLSVFDNTSGNVSVMSDGKIYAYDGATAAYTYITGGYVNFSNTTGSSGFGLRSNAGVIEFKNSSGSWTSFESLEPTQPIYAIGSVTAYSASSLPSGWLWADGSEISRTTYADLFDLIGTTYGVGDGSTTFNLPDLRGRVVAGKDDMDNTVGTGGGAVNRLTSGSKAGVAGNTLGASGGVQQHLLTANESGLRNHTHTISSNIVSNTSVGGAANRVTSVGANTGGASLAGGGFNAEEAHTNVQPTLILNYIIRYTNAEANAAFWSKEGSDLNFIAGNVGIGTTTPQRLLHVYRSSDGPPVRFEDSNGYCEINPTSTSWTCTSDERLKQNIQTIDSEDVLEKMMQIRPVTFEWKTDSTNTERIGFIAQEIEAIFPEFVSTDEETSLKSVSYGSFIPYIISVVQNIYNTLTELTQKIEELTSKSVNVAAGVITKLTIGSQEKPTGVTFFDEVTGEAYCLTVRNGNIITRLGGCSEDFEETPNNNSNSAPIINIEENNEQDIVSKDFEAEEQSEEIIQSDSSNGNLVSTSEDETESEVYIEPILEEDDMIVETNSSSGSVGLPIN
jgi:microcystin-dependent protein